MINLLSNAVKYTPENGIIRLRAEELPQVVNNYSRVRFTVSDNGMGMSEAFQKVLFEPFAREEHNQAIHEIQGTGLGMPITQNLVDLMGGTIAVESRQGEGSKQAIYNAILMGEKSPTTSMSLCECRADVLVGGGS